MKLRRVMAVGCTHGEFVHPDIRKQVLEFKRRFKPEIRFDLGDLIDTACFRRGATGTKDESARPGNDKAMAVRWLREYEPTHIAWGNHDWRLYDLRDHPKAIVAELAGLIWEDLQSEVRKLKAKTVPYDIQDGWHYLGGVAWGHGFMFNEFAVRDHAEMVGCPVVMAHMHRPHHIPGRTLRDTHSFCVGAIADDRQLTYGRRRRASANHGHGIVYGEICDDKAHLELIHSPNGVPLHIPSWI